MKRVCLALLTAFFLLFNVSWAHAQFYKDNGKAGEVSYEVHYEDGVESAKYTSLEIYTVNEIPQDPSRPKDGCINVYVVWNPNKDSFSVPLHIAIEVLTRYFDGKTMESKGIRVLRIIVQP